MFCDLKSVYFCRVSPTERQVNKAVKSTVKTKAAPKLKVEAGKSTVKTKAAPKLKAAPT